MGLVSYVGHFQESCEKSIKELYNINKQIFVNALPRLEQGKNVIEEIDFGYTEDVNHSILKNHIKLNFTSLIYFNDLPIAMECENEEDISLALKFMYSIINKDCSIVIGNKVFYDYMGLATLLLGDYVKIDNGYYTKDRSKLIKYLGSEIEYSIIEGTKIIGAGAFLKNAYLENIKIPESVEKIDCFAFTGCYNLLEIIIPKNVNCIEYNAFIYSSYIIKFVSNILPKYCNQYWMDEHDSRLIFDCLNNELDDMGQKFIVLVGIRYRILNKKAYVSKQRESVKECAIPSEIIVDNIKYEVCGIDANAFAFCEDLTKISISKLIKYIAVRAFYNCIKLKEVILEEDSQLERIEHCAFEMCYSLKYFKLPKTINYLGQNIFHKCENLQKVVFDDECKLERINESVFENCLSLKTVVLSKYLKIIGAYAFNNCQSLTDIIVDKNNSIKKIEIYAFKKCTSLKEFYIPKKVKSISQNVFDECSSLEKIIKIKNGIFKRRL